MFGIPADANRSVRIVPDPVLNREFFGGEDLDVSIEKNHGCAAVMPVGLGQVTGIGVEGLETLGIGGMVGGFGEERHPAGLPNEIESSDRDAVQARVGLEAQKVVGTVVQPFRGITVGFGRGTNENGSIAETGQGIALIELQDSGRTQVGWKGVEPRQCPEMFVDIGRIGVGAAVPGDHSPIIIGIEKRSGSPFPDVDLTVCEARLLPDSTGERDQNRREDRDNRDDGQEFD